MADHEKSENRNTKQPSEQKGWQAIHIPGPLRSDKSTRLLIFLGGLLVLAIILFILANQNVNTMMDNERSTYINEVSAKIASQISSTLNHLDHEAAMLPGIFDMSSAGSFEDCRKLFEGAFVQGKIMLISEDGSIYSLTGEQTNMNNRDLLVEVVFGRKNTFSYETDVNRKDYWVFCYPCNARTIDGKNIVGIMMAYPAEDFASEFFMQLFGEQGYALLCDNSGSIRLRPKDASWIGYNFYSTLIDQGATEEDIRQIEAAFANGEQLNLNVTLNNSRWQMYCTSLKDDSLGSLSNLVIMVPIEIITNQVSTGMQAAIWSALFVAIVIAAIIIVLYLRIRQATEERRRQDENAQLEIALRTAQVKSDFLARMSHDIRTPLNAIIGLNYIAAQNETRPEVITDCNRKLGASADYLLQLLNDVLDMSKIGSGKLEIAHTTFSMEEVLNNLSTMIKPRADEKEQSFSIDAPEDFGENYIGDRLRILQVLMNLLTNAVKFTPSGGKVIFTCRTQHNEEGNAIVEFIVADTGIGMSDEYMRRLFAPFEQEDSMTADQYGGSGLGLSIVHSLVTMMDGTIGVDSTKGKGSVFTVRLPLDVAERKEAYSEERIEAEENILKGKHILLAEDNKINQQIVVTILNSMGMEVDTADNGRLALEKFLSVPPLTYDMIVSDIRMPEMDGYAFAAAVRSSNHPEAETIPMVALSANAFEEDIAKSLMNGMNAHLRKPIEVDELRRELSRLLRERESDRKGVIA